MAARSRLSRSTTRSGRNRSTRPPPLRCAPCTIATACASSWPAIRCHARRRPALQQAGVDRLFSVALLSYVLGVRKPEPLFYRLVLAAAESPPDQVMFVGDNLAYAVAEPIAHGMRAALVRPHGLRPGEELPPGALLIRHVNELPGLLEEL